MTWPQFFPDAKPVGGYCTLVCVQCMSGVGPDCSWTGHLIDYCGETVSARYCGEACLSKATSGRQYYEGRQGCFGPWTPRYGLGWTRSVATPVVVVLIKPEDK